MEPQGRTAWKRLSFQHRAVNTISFPLPSPSVPGAPVEPQLLEPQQSCSAPPTRRQLQLGTEPALAPLPGHVSRSLAAVDQELYAKQSVACVLPKHYSSSKSSLAHVVIMYGASTFHFSLFPVVFEGRLSAGR